MIKQALVSNRVANATGKANITWSNGDTYVGEICGNRIHGNGTYYFASEHATYVGNWHMDIRTGKGKCTYANGVVYDGNWGNNHRSGHGTLRFPNGDYYEGAMRYDRRHGRGKAIFANGSEYNGYWEYDKQSGHGKLVYASGNYYEGNWKDGEYHGSGTFCTITEGRTYVGEWLHNQRHGYGEETLSNGVKYCGSWANNEKRGDGVLFSAAGAELEIFSSNPSNTNEQDTSVDESTTGVINYPNGDTYSGALNKAGQAHGFGQITFVNGSIYIGEMKNDLIHGNGVMYDVDGICTIGQWEHGEELIKEEIPKEEEIKQPFNEETYTFDYDSDNEQDESPDNLDHSYSYATANSIPIKIEDPFDEHNEPVNHD